jgi:hypothetical protein
MSNLNRNVTAMVHDHSWRLSTSTVYRCRVVLCDILLVLGIGFFHGTARYGLIGFSTKGSLNSHEGERSDDARCKSNLHFSGLRVGAKKFMAVRILSSENATANALLPKNLTYLDYFQGAS